MTRSEEGHSTGLTGLDGLLTGLRAGDNVVWEVDAVEDYAPFIAPYAANAVARGRQVVYFRFAKHPPLVAPAPGVEIRELDPGAGFEAFVSEIHRVAQRIGPNGYYVFDLLSDLAVDWYSDQMLGNFFRLICPRLYEIGAIAYFGLLRGYHSPQEATGPIGNTTQILLDVFRHRERLYVHPRKVEQRYSTTMYMLHAWDGDEFRPMAQSATVTEVLTSGARAEAPAAGRTGVWNRAFLEAEEAVDPTGRCRYPVGDQAELFQRLLRMVLTRDERMLALLARYAELKDLLEVRKRMIGTGLIGGKSVGMLVARAILSRADPRWNDLLEPHDSFYVGSDVFYTFIVHNGLWWVRERPRDPAAFLDGAERARQQMLAGSFPDYIVRQFSGMLDYFGQSPIIVRSSSLLEDSFGNSFAGKYDSYFCANQGPREKRLEAFLATVRSVYASTMSERALAYRAARGLLDRDEQMALLVQRVSGDMHGRFFYPHVAGVGLSYNPYVWSDAIDAEAGVARIVFGLGTRAVERSDDDYTRVVALNAPERRPESTQDYGYYSQKRVDVIDLNKNQFSPSDFREVAGEDIGVPLRLLASRDPGLERHAAETRSGDVFSWVLTFDTLLKETGFASDLKRMLRALNDAYAYPVDTEFTANFSPAGGYRINLVQCRPLQVKAGGAGVERPNVGASRIVLAARGAVVGQSRVETIDRLVYVSPPDYDRLKVQDRYAVARAIGRVLRAAGEPRKVLLLGPGRWGTTTPSLGVPARFREISPATALCEIVAMRDDLVPDVSLGTHFFNELVEMDMLYFALFPGKEGNILKEEFFRESPSRFAELAPEEARFASVVRVLDVSAPGRSLKLSAMTPAQEVLCYFEDEEEPVP